MVATKEVETTKFLDESKDDDSDSALVNEDGEIFLGVSTKLALIKNVLREIMGKIS